MARPSIKSPELLMAICEGLMDGQSLREICAADDMPGVTTVRRWVVEDEAFRNQYARACEVRADRWADEILEIADDATNDWMERQQGEDTVTVVDHEHIARSKLRIDARKWLMAKAAPKKYGEKVQQEVNVNGSVDHVHSGQVGLSETAAFLAGFAGDESKRPSKEPVH